MYVDTDVILRGCKPKTSVHRKKKGGSKAVKQKTCQGEILMSCVPGVKAWLTSEEERKGWLDPDIVR